jgi:cytochrome c5
MRTPVLLVLLALVIAGCTSSRLLTPTEADVARVSDRYPGYTLARLNEGKTLYTNHCGSCHPLWKPASQTEAQWKAIMPDMVAKVNKKKSGALTADDSETILRYLFTMRDAPAGK